MLASRWDDRFFASTRGQVVLLLRRGSQTVDEIALPLGLTDNAVRAHLAALERDGLVRQGALRRGGGKPSFTYELTPDADRLFPKPYGAMLAHLLAVLGEQLPPEQLDDALREAGRRVAAGLPAPAGALRDRVERAIRLLDDMGGLADVEERDGGFVIAGCACPISAAVEGCGRACLFAESLLAEVIGAPVRQVCDQGPPPRCRFEVEEIEATAT